MTLADELRAFREMRWKERPAKYRDGLTKDHLSTLLDRSATRLDLLEEMLTRAEAWISTQPDHAAMCSSIQEVLK